MRKFAIAAIAALALAGCSSSTDAGSATSTSPTGTADVAVSGAYILQPAGNVAGMFGMVVNEGDASVKLTGGSAPGAGMVQIHEFVKDGNTETMREVPGGLEVPAGGSVELKPGSYHVMLMDLTATWQPGDTVPVTLNLSDGSTVTVDADVEAREGMDSMDSMQGS
jgi:copper(I)-binding protein